MDSINVNTKLCFPLAMTYGKKPANLDFPNDIVDELDSLL